VVSRSSGLVLASTVLAEEPTAATVWDQIVRAMQHPAAGEPHRPSQIQVLADPRWDDLRPYLEQVGIELQTSDELEFLDEVFGDLKQHLLKDEPPGLLDMPRMTPEMIGSFFRAAADYYRQAPWRSLGYEEAIKVECQKFQSGPWYAVVMGQSGVTLGLALYEDLALLKRLWSNRYTDREAGRQTVALAVTYDPEVEVHPRDVDDAKQHGWEVANPEAFPTVYHKQVGMSLRPPLSWELVLLEGCLRAIPTFLAERPPGNTTPQTLTVPVATGKLELTLSRVED
jgi:hypothetical protein